MTLHHQHEKITEKKRSQARISHDMKWERRSRVWRRSGSRKMFFVDGNKNVRASNDATKEEWKKVILGFYDHVFPSQNRIRRTQARHQNRNQDGDTLHRSRSVLFLQISMPLEKTGEQKKKRILKVKQHKRNIKRTRKDFFLKVT